MIRLRDVAERAGVSTATTSRVLSGSSHVRETLRQRVLVAAKELNYTPDGIARSMTIRRTLTFGVVVADIASPFFTSVVRGVEDVAHKNGYSVILCNTDEDVDKERAYLSVLREKRVDGILLSVASEETAHVQRLIDAGTKLVLLDRTIPNISIPSVQVDNFGGVYQATSYLLGLGHRRIAMETGNLALTTARQRLAGFEAAMQAAGVPLDRELLVPAGLTEHGGYEAALRIWALRPRPTAVISWANTTTTGLLQGLRKCGARVPDDLSVVGFDDLPYFLLLEHPLTVVSQPAYEVGRCACALLLRLIRDDADLMPEESQIRLPTQFIIRESCRPVDERGSGS